MTKRWAPVIALSMAAPAIHGGCKHKDEIPMEHGKKPANTPAPAPTPSLRTGAPKLAWRAPVSGTVIAPPVGAGSLVVVATVTPGNAQAAGTIEAFDASTGAARWRLDRDGGLDGGVATTPVVADGRVVVATNAGTVYALDASDGRVVWKASLGRRSLAGVAVNGNLVYAVGEGTTLHALDLRTGTAQWEAPAGTGAYAAPAAAGTDVYVGSEDGTVRAVAPAGGAVSWQLALPASMPVGLTVTKDLVLVSLLGDRSLRALDRATHAERWRFGAASAPGPVPRAPVPAIARDVATIVDGDQLTGLSLATGAPRWTTAVGGTLVPPLAIDDAVLVAVGRELRALDGGDGSLLWSLPLEQPATSSVGTHGGALYVVDASHQLVAFEP